MMATLSPLQFLCSAVQQQQTGREAAAVAGRAGQVGAGGDALLDCTLAAVSARFHSVRWRAKSLSNDG